MTAMDLRFILLDILQRQPRSTQREMSRLAGLSLGKTNKVLRQLVSGGLVRANALGGRRWEYQLTAKGQTEYRQGTYAQALRALHQFSRLEKTIQEQVLKAYTQGVRNFVVLGGDEESRLVERAIQSLALELAP